MKHELDKIVRDKLYNYSAPAPDDAWKNIQAGISKSKRRSIAPVYWRAIAAAVALLISFGSGSFLSLNNQPTNEVIANAKLNFFHTHNFGSLKPVFVSGTKINIIEPINVESEHANGIISIVSSQRQMTETNHLESKNAIQIAKLDKNQYYLPLTKTGENKNGEVQEHKSLTYTPEELIAMQDSVFNTGIATPDEKTNMWAIGGQFSPNYSYREMKNNSTDMPSDYYNSVENALVTYSGGFNVNFKVNKVFALESGINYAQIGQTSNLLYAQQNPAKGSAYEVATSAGIITPRPTAIQQISGQYRYVDPLGNIINTDANLIQNFNYLEIPLNARITVLDKKVGVAIISGINTNFLLGNKVFFEQGKDKTYIGQTENLNDVRYSTNFRIGIDYKISSKFSFNFEPGFKYSLIPINKNPEIDNYPYTFGVSTGFIYKF